MHSLNSISQRKEHVICLHSILEPDAQPSSYQGHTQSRSPSGHTFVPRSFPVRQLRMHTEALGVITKQAPVKQLPRLHRQSSSIEPMTCFCTRWSILLELWSTEWGNEDKPA